MIIRSRKEAAKKLGITERQLGNWAHEPWFPADAKSPKGWDVDLIRQIRDAMGLKGSDDSTRAKQIKLAREEERLKRDQILTIKEQLKLDRDRGHVIPRAGVELFASTILTELADWCDQVPDIIANTVPAKIRKELRNRINDELDKRRANMREQLQREAKLLDEQKGAP